MAFAHYSLAIPFETSNPHKTSILTFSSTSSSSASLLPIPFSSLKSAARKLSLFPHLRSIGHKAKAKPQESEVSLAADAFTHFKHLLLPITDRNPYLSEGTRQAATTTTALAKKYGADITVVVIDEKLKESLPEHDTQLSSVRWHLSEDRLTLLTAADLLASPLLFSLPSLCRSHLLFSLPLLCRSTTDFVRQEALHMLQNALEGSGGSAASSAYSEALLESLTILLHIV